MSEKMPFPEALPDPLEVRRDAVLLRIAVLREAVKDSSFNPDVVSKELDELDGLAQQLSSVSQIAIAEEILDTLEKIVDSKK